jgi:hypothetical protein
MVQITSCSNQLDVANCRKALRDLAFRPSKGLVAAALRNPASTADQLIAGIPAPTPDVV